MGELSLTATRCPSTAQALQLPECPGTFTATCAIRALRSALRVHFGQSRAYGVQLADKARKLSNTTMWLTTTGLMTRGVIDVAIAFGAAGALALGAHRVTQGEMSLQALLIVLMAGTEIFRPLRDFRGVLHEGQIGQAAGIAINELLSTPTEQRQATAAAPQKLSPTIDFENVRFSYPGGRGIALDGVSFSLAAGERVGVVGPSGSGKSTIARLLLQLYTAQEGVVKIGGIDIRTLDLRTPISSTARSRTICVSARRTRRRPSSKRPRAPPMRMISSPACRRAIRRLLASAGRGSPAASASVSRSRARCCATRRS